MEWTTPASLTLRLGKQAYDRRHLLQEYWTRFKAKFDMGSTQVAVTGYANAGKTILAQQLDGAARGLGYEKPTTSTAAEPAAIRLGEWHRLFRVIPGQEGKRAKSILSSFHDNKDLEGVVHVVDFGFNKPRTKAAETTLITIDKIDNIEKLRAHNLQNEIHDISTLCHDIKLNFEKNGQKIWLVIAVNKVDLFYNQLDSALSRYHPNGNSDFSRALAKMEREIGSNHISIDILPICVFEEDFEWNGETIKSGLGVNVRDALILDALNSVALISGNQK
jgi:signal recognition particle receptor subunit beta